MWMIKPELLCNKHLLGEHGEIHKHRHNFVKKHNISGRIYPVVQIEPSSMKKRHDEVAKEMLKRKMNHQSDYKQPNISYLKEDLRNAKVDLEKSIKDLIERCEDCKKRILK
jgi:hypothetical protein